MLTGYASAKNSQYGNQAKTNHNDESKDSATTLSPWEQREYTIQQGRRMTSGATEARAKAKYVLLSSWATEVSEIGQQALAGASSSLA